MTQFDIECYLNSLSEDVEVIDVRFKNITYLPNITRFKNLQELYCANNKLSYLPDLPDTIKIISCSNNKITSLSRLPKNLEMLYCDNNELTSLPILPENLQVLYCDSNKLTFIPTFNDKVLIAFLYNNPICELINTYYINDSNLTKQSIRIINNFRHLYYCLKFKKQFRKILWEKIREKKLIKKYHPTYLIENLTEDTDLDIFLSNW